MKDKRRILHRWMLVVALISATPLRCTTLWSQPQGASRIFAGDVKYVVVNPSTGTIANLPLPRLHHDPGTALARHLTVFPDRKRFVFSNAQWADAGGLMRGWFQNGRVRARQLTRGWHDAPCSSWNQKRIAFIFQHRVAIFEMTSGKVRVVADIPKSLAPYDIPDIARPVAWTECVWTRDDRGLLCVWEDPFLRGILPSLWYVGLSPRDKPVKLLDNADYPVVNPKDGRVAFVRMVETPESGGRRKSEVWLGRWRPGHGLHPLQKLRLQVLDNVAWSPDGRKLAFLKDNGNTLAESLWVYDLVSERRKRIAGPSDRLQGFVAW